MRKGVSKLKIIKNQSNYSNNFWILHVFRQSLFATFLSPPEWQLSVVNRHLGLNTYFPLFADGIEVNQAHFCSRKLNSVFQESSLQAELAWVN